MTDDTATLLAAARSARRQRRFEEAVALFDRTLALAPQHLAARIERTGALVQAGRVQEAAAAAGTLLAENADHPAIRMEAAVVARALGRHEEALDHYEVAARHAAEPGPALINVANLARQAGRLQRALEAAHAATECLPGSTAAWMALALAARAAEETSTEQAALQRAAEADPTDPGPLLALARAAIAAGDPAGAAAWLDEAQARAPDSPAAALQRGHVALTLGDMDGALESFRRAVALDPDLLAAHAGLIHCLLRREEIDAAGAALVQAEARLGMPPALAVQRAAWLQRRGRATEARPLLRRAATTPGEGRFARWEAWWRLEARIGDAVERGACLAEAHPTVPAEVAAAARAAGLSAEIDFDFAAAATAYDRALAAMPTDGTAMDGQARLAALRLDGAAARDWLRRQAQAEVELRRKQRRGTNPSQTQTGQIAAEFRLDRDGCSGLRPLLGLPPAIRLPPLLALVRDLPESTAAALWLLISLRQAGALDVLPSTAPMTIPRRLLWLLPQDAPDASAAVARWTAVNPGIEIVPMNAGAALSFLESRHGSAARMAWRRARDRAVRVDLLQLVWLAECGGWTVPPGAWADAPFESLGIGDATFCAAQELWGAPGFTLLGAAPGHPIVMKAAASVIEAMARGDEDIRWLRSGPGLLARITASSLAADPTVAAGMRLVTGSAANRVAAPDPSPWWSSANFR
ncbi:tetratricopeptide repeat protein [Roseomonas sp. HJA6]|uniref:Tetratricopeptide repeat protein n=1 Tax=Roseomonas alba TaxID=2846776 RepID=A0ABS7A8U9_9PROT|nr:tetratricopeptide repeat protein [Neoroseomonas alba]MBW6398725.1 tetratricopeptide repeat protein [Neoroseomonas alba]